MALGNMVVTANIATLNVSAVEGLATKSNIMKPIIIDRAKMVGRLAKLYLWEYIGCDEKTYMVSFTKNGCRLNVYLSKMTVATALNHPFKGKTQLFRKQLSMTELEKVFANPRVHTDKGYIRKRKKS